MESYKTKHSLEDRVNEYKRLKKKHPDRTPIILSFPKNSEFESLAIKHSIKTKYLVPSDHTIGQFIFVIRSQLKLRPEQALFIFVNNDLPSTSELISQVHHKHKDEDGLLYFTICPESTFG